MGIAKTIQEVLMNKLFRGLHATLRVLAWKRQLTAAGLLISIVLAGCIATENRIAAGKMREQVMRYYNDEIMENLIRTYYQLPFVHVDVSSLTTTDVAQVTGSVGGGNMRTETRTGPMVSAVHAFSRAVTWPFSYSVSPNRSDSMQITANTVLGQFSPEPSPLPPPDKFEVSKETTTVKLAPTPKEPTPTPKSGETAPAPSTVTEVSTEKTAPKAPATNIYNLYEDFLYDATKYTEMYHGSCPSECSVTGFPNAGPLGGPRELFNQPSPSEYVEGTLRIWHGQYYYIKSDCRCRYYAFCKKLFTKSQANSVGQQFQALQNLIESVKGQLPPSVPQAPPP
jgi:predicted RNA-binding protein YlxR (DUF448 family)